MVTLTNAMEVGKVKGVPMKHHRSMLDVSKFMLRVLVVAATLSATVVMGRNKQTVTLIDSSAMDAKYNYSLAFMFFAVLSLVISLLKSMKSINTPCGFPSAINSNYYVTVIS